MKKLMVITLALVLVLSLVIGAGVAVADKPQDDEGVYNGNGAPSGEHVTLNIIGVQNPKTQSMTYPVDDPSGRSTIFVKLSGTTRIYLYDGGDIDDLANWKDAFGVIDANGTDGVAAFQLGNPDYDAYVIGGDMTGVDTICDYLIMARPLGKPDGFATMTTCAELTESALFGMLPASDRKEINNLIDGVTGAYISVEQVPAEFTFRDSGKKNFENVTAYLTSIVFQVTLYDEEDNVIGVYYVRVPIFDDMLENEYWKYDNSGLKLLQVRFYPIETDVTYADEPFLP
jgi:hypothetical protein